MGVRVSAAYCSNPLDDDGDVCEAVDDVVAGVGDAEDDRVLRRDAVLFGARTRIGLSPSDSAVESTTAGASVTLDA
jgi:hypothetical protein